MEWVRVNFKMWNKISKAIVPEMQLRIRVGHDCVRQIKVAKNITVKELLEVLAPKDENGKVMEKFSIAVEERDFHNRLRNWKFLDGKEGLLSFMFESEEAPLNEDGIEEECRLWLIDTSSKTTVFFNSYYRMLTGVPMHYVELYPEPGMTVFEFVEHLKSLIGIAPNDERFGLFGYYKTRTDRLKLDDLILELRKEDDLKSPFLFQFQLMPEHEDCRLLGITRSSNLVQHVNSAFVPVKKRWVALKGNSLFIYENQNDPLNYRVIDNIEKCQIIYRGANSERTYYRFDIKDGDGKVYTFSSPLKKRIERWVSELRRAKASIEISEPVTMVDVEKYKMMKVVVQPPKFVAPTATNEPMIVEIPFSNRRNVENVEAILRKIEMDGGVIQLNGVERPLGKKWAESVRSLLHLCSLHEQDIYAKECVPKIYDILIKLRAWMHHFEGDPERPPSPTESIKEIVEDCVDLTTSYRYHVLKFQSQAENVQDQSPEARKNRELLEKLQNSLINPIFTDSEIKSQLKKEKEIRKKQFEQSNKYQKRKNRLKELNPILIEEPEKVEKPPLTLVERLELDDLKLRLTSKDEILEKISSVGKTISNWFAPKLEQPATSLRRKRDY